MSSAFIPAKDFEKYLVDLITRIAEEQGIDPDTLYIDFFPKGVDDGLQEG